MATVASHPAGGSETARSHSRHYFLPHPSLPIPLTQQRLQPLTQADQQEPEGPATNTSLSIFSPGPFSGLPIWHCLSPPSPGESAALHPARREDNLSLRLDHERVWGADEARSCWGKAWEDSWVSGGMPRAEDLEKRKTGENSAARAGKGRGQR